MKSLLLHEYRCSCGKLLFKGVVFSSNIEIKCRGCGKMNYINGMLREKQDLNEKKFSFLLDKKGMVVDASKTVENILGYSINEFIGKNLADFSFTEQTGLTNQIFQALENSNDDTFYHVTVIYKDAKNNAKNFDVSFRLFKGEKEDYIFSIAEEAKNDIFVSSDNIDILSDGYCEIDKNLIINCAKAKNGFNLGYDQSEILGKKITDLIHLDDLAQKGEMCRQAMVDQKPFRMMDCRMLEKSGEIVLCDVYFVPNYNDRGDWVGYKIMSWVKNKSK